MCGIQYPSDNLALPETFHAREFVHIIQALIQSCLSVWSVEKLGIIVCQESIYKKSCRTGPLIQHSLQ